MMVGMVNWRHSIRKPKTFASLAFLFFLAAPPLTGTSLAPPPGDQFAYVTNRDSDNVSVIDVATNAVVATVPVGDGPWGVAVTPDGTKAYVTNFFAHSVSVIDVATNTVLATLPVGLGPEGVAVTPDGATAYVVNRYGATVSVIDVATNTVVGPPIPVAPSIRGIVITPDGTKAYVTRFTAASVYVIDLTTNTVIGSPIPVGDIPQLLAITPDGSTVYVPNPNFDNVLAIDVANDAITATIPAGNGAFSIAVTPDGTAAYVGNTLSGNVSVIDLATNMLVGPPIPVGNSPEGIGITSDGVSAYVVNRASNTVSVINVATQMVVATLPVGDRPFGIAITSARTGPVLLELPADFSENQGDNGLTYLAFNDNRPTNTENPNAGGTNPLIFQGEQSIVNGTATNTGPTYLHSSFFFPYVLKDTNRDLLLLHPGTFANANVGSAIVYEIPVSGTYRLSGGFARANNFQAGDGVDVAIFKNSETESPLLARNVSSSHVVDEGAPFAGTGVTLVDLTTTLESGDQLEFVVFSGPQGQDGTFDVTAFKLEARLTDTNPLDVVSQLQSRVQALVTSGMLAPSDGQILITLLDVMLRPLDIVAQSTAQDAVFRRAIRSFDAKLESFVRWVSHLVGGSRLSPSEGELLVTILEGIQNEFH